MNLPHKIPSEALQMLRDGQLIQAIKITREKTGLGLKESKDLIDQYLNEHPQEQTRIQEQLTQRSRSGLKVFVLIFLVLVVLIWFVTH
ncbi:ribosomal protein L7/L12 [Acinetobacter haemolyticus]|uniref:ribosomal protein L7/L12 n=1 Tax=Acinetobacter haemolyticus TaxID=29430 RepID=UPI000D688742|nr:ribosomal protein L7/L12 [Acinetobacter haemolyticus]